MKKWLSVLLVFLFCANKSEAQVDPHFSQFYAYPLWLSPGLTGAGDGYRVTAIYRNQWRNVTSPFSTIGVSGDIATDKNLNIGGNILRQTAGDGGYQYLNGYLTVAYTGLRFGTENNQQIAFGIQAGVLDRRFNISKFQFGDQWNPITGYNPGATTADLMVSGRSSTVLDIGAGMAYMDNTPDKQVNFFGGVAAYHLTQPEDPFVNSGEKKFLPVRFALHTGASIAISESASLTPNLLYLRQGNAQEKAIGVYGKLKVNEITDLLAGVNYRFKDAFSPYVGVGYLDFLVGLSYDVNNSELGKAVTGTNSFEISLTWTGHRSGKSLRYLACPRL